MGLCGASDINVKEGLSDNLSYDINGNQLDNTSLYSKINSMAYTSIKTYNNNKIFEIEIEAFIGEREYPIYVSKNSKIEINVLEDKKYLWSFLPDEKKIDFKGYKNFKYNKFNLGCLLVRVSTSNEHIPILNNKTKFISNNKGSLVFSANLDINECLFYEPKGSLKLIVKGGELCDMKTIDELTEYEQKNTIYKKKDDKAYSEINLTILRYINKARINTKKYISDFIIDFEMSEEDFPLFNNKKLSFLEIDNKLYKAAESHCKFLCTNGTSGDIGSEGSTLKERLEKQKIKSKEFSECIIYGYSNPIIIVNSLIVNKYAKNNKYRKSILNDKYKKIGISLGEHLTYGYCCVIIFSE